MISIPRSEPTKILVESPVKMDLIRISSCNRDKTYEKIGQSMAFTYDYDPTDVEKEGMCPIYLQIFDERLLTSWGLIAFKTTEKLHATVSCDGDQYDAEGLDSCQSMVGFEQGLDFKVPIKYTTRGPCQVIRLNEKSLRVRTSDLGFCQLTAYDQKDFFKFILLGYDEVLVRGKKRSIDDIYTGWHW